MLHANTWKSLTSDVVFHAVSNQRILKLTEKSTHSAIFIHQQGPENIKKHTFIVTSRSPTQPSQKVLLNFLTNLKLK